jgi:uncharacterized membrane protein
MLAILLALLIGIVTGLRTLTAPAAISWGVYLGWLNLQGSWLAFLDHPLAPWILTVLALGELVADQLPFTPSRTHPTQFAGRIVSGALCGAAIGVSSEMLVGGIVAGALGAVLGTLGGHAARARLAVAFGQDRPAALIEGAVAILGALIIVRAA